MDALKVVFGDHREPITDQTSAEDVSGWDSFSHVQLIFEIERLLGRRVDIGKTYDIENVGALIQFLETPK
jgi:acyl carrier protein